eukprot:TRINITY_DN61611_c0_g1_i1.p1 TRINITY_DN61611_c0_g1~~TRINITY_DN61611_c0_g1_i1.p1  ORF type:complete len:184 (-),score=43.93 TRINITY_DN61611_c0_g1_i1:107-658(-)
MSKVILGTNRTSPRSEIPIGTEPRLTNLSTAPLCSSYDPTTRYYHDPRVEGDEIAPVPNTSKTRCTTVSGLIMEDQGVLWKVLTGNGIQQACYTGPHFPNKSTVIPSSQYVQDCENGCLFDLSADPLETTDVANKHPEVIKAMYAKMEKYESSAFNPHRGDYNPKACQAALTKYSGFWGPFLN